MKTFVLWRSIDGQEETLVLGHKIPKDLINPRYIYVIEAETFEEAQAIRYLRNGWEPYKPGEPKKCPKCPAFYYFGSGECQCGYRENN